MKKFMLTGLIFASMISIGLAQDPAKEADDGPTGIFSSRTEYYQFIGGAKQAAYGPDGSAELREMIPLLNDIVLNQPIGKTANDYSSASRTTLGLLADPKVRDEIEMVDQQYDQLQDLNRKLQERMANQVRQLDFSDTTGLVEQIKSMRQRSQDELESVLLPHQLERLQQLAMRSLLRRQSLVQVITNDPIKSDLDISDEQTEQLRDAEAEIKEELQKKIMKLQEEARQELIGRLRPEQQSRVKKMIGDTFEFPEAQRSRGNKKQSGNNKGKFRASKKGD
ncbi:MAG: hypothetical protein AAFN77_23005 [Planctomycetota bacterium]